jgi:hypothetical protein
MTKKWVEAFAGNHQIPIQWGEKGVRKEDYVLPWLRRMRKKRAYGVYFIFKSMEQGPTTSVCEVHLLTVAFTTNQTPTIGPRANLKLPMIRLTGLSKTLSISWMQRDTALAILRPIMSMILEARI